MTMVIKSLLFACSVLFPFSLSAKSDSPPKSVGITQLSQQYWDEDKLVESDFLINQLRVWNPSTGVFEIIDGPSGSAGISMSGGVATCLRMTHEKILFSRRSPKGAWVDYETSLNHSSGPSDLKGVPLTLAAGENPNRFLGMNLLIGFSKEKAVSCCSWWKQNDNGVLEAEDLIPIELDAPVFLPSPQPVKGPAMTLSPRYPGLPPFLEYPIRVSGAYLVVSMNSGVLWVLKDDSIRTPSVIKLLPRFFDQLVAKASHPAVIHCLQPMRNGHILVAMRSIEALFDPPVAQPSRIKDIHGKELPPTPPTVSVVWRDVDPLNCTVSEADQVLLADAPRTLPLNGKLSFKFDPKGRLVHSLQYESSRSD